MLPSARKGSKLGISKLSVFELFHMYFHFELCNFHLSIVLLDIILLFAH